MRSPGLFKGAPRGTVAVTPRMRDAHGRYCSGESAASIARSMGVRPQTVIAWCKAVREADRDARLIASDG